VHARLNEELASLTGGQPPPVRQRLPYFRCWLGSWSVSRKGSARFILRLLRRF
jgi:hypothetical protein